MAWYAGKGYQILQAIHGEELQWRNARLREQIEELDKLYMEARMSGASFGPEMPVGEQGAVEAAECALKLSEHTALASAASRVSTKKL